MISRNSGLLCTGFGAIQNDILLNVLKVALKILEKFQEVMEFLFGKLQAYKLQTSAVCLYKVLENSNKKDYSGVTFVRSRHYRLSSQMAVLNSFLENSKGGQQAHLKRTSHGYVTRKFPKFLLPFISRTNFITPRRLKFVKK